LALAALKEPLDQGTDLFQPSNLEPVTIDTGNPATNVIPQRASARINVRFNPTWTRASLEAELRKRLDAIDWQGCRYSLAVKDDASEAFYTPPGPFVDALVEAIESATGVTPQLSTSGGTSDARFIKTIALSSSSAWSARRCIRSTSMLRSPIWKPWPISMFQCLNGFSAYRPSRCWR
jgi:succinyl-diaminopimelate desuccinylase